MRNKKHLLRITISALFIAISIVLTRFFVFPYGPTFFRLTLGNVPIILGGILMGPIYGALIGFGADIVGATLFPSGNFLIFPMISSIFYGAIPGLVFMVLRKYRTKIRLPLVYPSIAVLYLLGVIYFLLQSTLTNPFDRQVSYTLTPMVKVISLIVSALLVAGLLVALFFTDRRLKLKDSYQNVLPSDFAMTIIITELIVDVIYTPIWKHYFFGLPYLFALFVHILILLTLLILKTSLINLIAYSFNKSKIEI